LTRRRFENIFVTFGVSPGFSLQTRRFVTADEGFSLYAHPERRARRRRRADRTHSQPERRDPAADRELAAVEEDQS